MRNAAKRLFGGGSYDLVDNLVLFKAEPLAGSGTMSTGGDAFDEAPSAMEWRQCNWEGDHTYINDEWPLNLRQTKCEGKSGCGFDASDGLCKAVIRARGTV